jgi:hypothetical protein
MVRAQTDRTTVMIGAIGALHGVMCLLYCTVTMYLNQQRPAIPLGLICGLLLRVRQIQSAVAEEYAGYEGAYGGYEPLFSTEPATSGQFG